VPEFLARIKEIASQSKILPTDKESLFAIAETLEALKDQKVEAEVCVHMYMSMNVWV
jgi:hypothetical protein